MRSTMLLQCFSLPVPHSINCYQTYLSTINPLYKRAARRYSAHEHYFASTVSGGDHILPPTALILNSDNRPAPFTNHKSVAISLFVFSVGEMGKDIGKSMFFLWLHHFSTRMIRFVWLIIATRYLLNRIDNCLF